MNFYRLGSTRNPLFRAAFALYRASFPKYELRLFEKQVALMSNPLYHFNAIMDEGALAGILLYWEGSGYVYIEHFAIHPSMQGMAMGSNILKAFCEQHTSVVLEIDPPANEAAIRRERFYHHLGFKTNIYMHLHPAYREEYPPHELLVMSYPKHLSGTEYQVFQQELQEIFMKDAAAPDGLPSGIM